MFNRLAQATKQYIARGKTESPVGKIILEAQTMTAAVQNPIPPSEKLLFTFKTESDLARWSTFTDQEFGGQSEALLTLSPTPPVRGTAFIPSEQQHILSMCRHSSFCPYICKAACSSCGPEFCDLCASLNFACILPTHDNTWRYHALTNSMQITGFMCYKDSVTVLATNQSIL